MRAMASSPSPPIRVKTTLFASTSTDATTRIASSAGMRMGRARDWGCWLLHPHRREDLRIHVDGRDPHRLVLGNEDGESERRGVLDRYLMTQLRAAWGARKQGDEGWMDGEGRWGVSAKNSDTQLMPSLRRLAVRAAAR
jgi:hypothetical protein